MAWLGLLGLLLAFAAIPAAIAGTVVVLTTRENQQRFTGGKTMEVPLAASPRATRHLELASFIVFVVITVPSCMVAIPLLLTALLFTLGMGATVIISPVIIFTLAGFIAIWRLHWTYLAKGLLPPHRGRYFALLGAGGLLCLGMVLPTLTWASGLFLIWPLSSVLFYLVLLLVLKPAQAQVPETVAD